MNETTTKQQMKNKNKSDGKHDDIDEKHDNTNNETAHNDTKNNKPNMANQDINNNAKGNKDLRQPDDQTHKHNIEKPSHGASTRN